MLALRLQRKYKKIVFMLCTSAYPASCKKWVSYCYCLILISLSLIQSSALLAELLLSDSEKPHGTATYTKANILQVKSKLRLGYKLKIKSN